MTEELPIEIHPLLYKRDTTGKIRVWCMHRQGDRHRVVAGLLEGKATTSEWTECKENPIHKRTPEEQALFEVEAEYRHQLAREYWANIAEIDNERHFFPMRAQTLDRKKMPAFPVFLQPKLDGIRCIAKADGLWSREGQPIICAPHVFEELHPFFEAYPDAVLDGELYNHVLKDDFEQILSLVKRKKPTEEDLARSKAIMQYHVYDCPIYYTAKESGGVLVDSEFSRRHLEGLVKLFMEYTEKLDPSKPRPLSAGTTDTWEIYLTGCIQIVPTLKVESEEQLDEATNAWLEEGYEGSMVRLGDKPYERGKKSRFMLKVKEFVDDEFEVLRLEKGNGNYAGLYKVAWVRLPNGGECKVTIAGDKKYLAKLNPDECKWATVKYFQYTKAGALRKASVKAFYAEKRNV